MHVLITKYFSREISATEREELFALMKQNKEMEAEFYFVQDLSAIGACLPRPDDQAQAAGSLTSFKRKRKNSFDSFAFPLWLEHAVTIGLAVWVIWKIAGFTDRQETLPTRTIHKDDETNYILIR